MSPTTLLRVTSAVLRVFAVVPLVAFFAMGYLIPIACLVAGLVLLGRRPRVAAALSAVGAALVGGGVLWAGWILGVVINQDPVRPGLELILAVALPVIAVACLVAASRVWVRAGRTPIPA